jgi:hypothetical protein
LVFLIKPEENSVLIRLGIFPQRNGEFYSPAANIMLLFLIINLKCRRDWGGNGEKLLGRENTMLDSCRMLSICLS